MYAISERYKEVIYSGDSDNRLKLLFNGVEYDTANIKSEKLTVTSRILSNGNDRFSLDNFVSKEAELIIHDIDLEDIVEPISISIGTLVDGEYEYVPIGIFKLNETPTTDSKKTTIKLRDNSVKFDIPYNAEEIINENGGSATILQVLQDICTKCNVELGTTEFLNMNSKISVWDNSINARVYIMYIAEKAGCIATIDRLGRLILVDLQEGEAIEKLSEDNTIYINDALPRKLLDLELKGDTQQDSYTGKNLFTTDYITGYARGDKIKINDEKTNDITLENCWADTFTNNSNVLNIFKPNTTYTIKCKFKVIERPSTFGVNNHERILFLYKSGVSVEIVKSSLKNTGTLNTWYETTQTITTPADLSGLNIIAYDFKDQDNATKGKIQIKELQIEEGSTATDYEPYVGGKASPNPDYPQEIKSVTGRQEIDVVGKNLFNKNLLPSTWSSQVVNMITLNVEPNTKYTMSSNIPYGGTVANLFLYDESGTGSTATNGVKDGKNVTVTSSSTGIIKVGYRSNLGTTVTRDDYWYQIEKGSTATTYEPYKGKSYEINLGKNLLDTSKFTSTTQATSIDSNSSEINLITNNYGNFITIFDNLGIQQGNYTIWCEVVSGTYTGGNLCFFDLSGTQYSTEFNFKNDNTHIKQINLTNGLNKLRIYSPKCESDTKIKIWLIKGNYTSDTMPSFSPYFTPIELNKIGNYQDSIKKSTGKNLFDKDNANILNAYFDEQTTTITSNANNRVIYISCNPDTTYTITKYASPYKRSIAYTTEEPNIGVQIYDQVVIPSNGTTGTITTGNNAKYLVIRLMNTNQDSSVSVDQMLSSVMINEGSTALPYEPYLPKGTWYLEKQIGKIVLDNNTPISNFRNKNNIFVNANYSNTNLFKKLDGNGSYGVMCNKLLSSNVNRTYSGTDLYGISQGGNGNYLQLCLPYSAATSISEVNDWITSNTPIVYYIKATPTYTEITNEELINQLESIELLKGLNNIAITSEDLASPLKITYQQEKQPIELNPLLFEKYTEGDLLKISRVVYEDAIRKFEYGDETDATLYINSANPYVINEEEIHNVYNNIKDFEMYSMNISKMIGNPAIDPWDMLQFTYNDKTYKFLGQNTLTFTKNIMQTFDTQIGTNEKAQENVTLNAEPSQFKRLFTRIDQAEGNIELNASQISTVQTDLRDNHYSKEQTEQLILNAESGITNTFSEAGGNNIFRNTGLWFTQTDGNNPFEFWNGNVVKYKEENASNMSALLLQNGTLYQEQLVPNGNYTISFKYKRLIQLATVKCKINDIEYELSEENETEFIKTIEVNSQHINVQFISDTNNSCEIYDLMVNAGSVKLAYSQNQNETTTDTVNISKGITITSSDVETTFKANADGVRIYDSKDLTNPKTKFTDKGMETDYLKVKEEAEVVDILIQRVGSHTWLTKI